MISNLKALSLSYKAAPLEIRELFALDDKGVHAFLSRVKEFTGLQEVLVLSTCNRTEVYYISEADLSTQLLKLLVFDKQPLNADHYLEYFEIINKSRQALRHLFRVAMGLESQVVGDMQVIAQVKQAYQLSADHDMAGPMMHRLLHTVFYTNKRVVQETSFKDGAASVSYAAAEITKELASKIIAPKILILGLGEIGTDVCLNLKDAGLQEVYVTNRTEQKAIDIAAETGFTAQPFAQFSTLIDQCDVIISSVAGKEPLVKMEFVQSLHIPGYKHFIDLSVPRSIETSVENIPGVTLQNIDGIQVKTNEALRKRQEAIPVVEAIIEETLADFSDWAKEMMVSPAIKKFKEALDDIRKEEMAKYLKKLDPKQAKVLDQVTKNMMQKIVKLPALNLKAACQRDNAEKLVDVLNELFNLEHLPEKKK
jgi:glutamyl-tRNA reductase